MRLLMFITAFSLLMTLLAAAFSVSGTCAVRFKIRFGIQTLNSNAAGCRPVDGYCCCTENLNTVCTLMGAGESCPPQTTTDLIPNTNTTAQDPTSGVCCASQNVHPCCHILRSSMRLAWYTKCGPRFTNAGKLPIRLVLG